MCISSDEHESIPLTSSLLTAGGHEICCVSRHRTYGNEGEEADSHWTMNIEELRGYISPLLDG